MATTGTNHALDFLRKFHSDGFWTLTSIRPERKAIETRTFTADTVADARAWIEKHNGQRNIYFSVNQPNGPVNKKADKGDIAFATCLHVDLDCRAGEPPEAELERLRRLVEDEHGWPDTIPRPQVTVFSGGGYQCFWLLDKPVEISGDVCLARDFERYNRALELPLGADNCHNVDRIMRLPGTINLPDEKKRKNGRTAVDAHVVFFNDVRVSLEKFKQAPPLTPPEDSKHRVVIGSDVPRIADLAKLDQWSIGNRVKDVVEHGKLLDPEELTEKQKGFSRSEWCFYAVCALARCQVPDDTIFSLITDPKYAVSEHVLDQKNVETYAVRQIEKAKERIATDPPLLDPHNPLPSARQFARRKWPTLMHYNDDWLAYAGSAYQELQNDTVRSEVYAYLEHALAPAKGENTPPVPFKPTATKVNNVLDALASVSHKPRDLFTPPCWLAGTDEPPARELLACSNGLLHLPGGQLYPGSEDFFTRNALEFDYDETAPAPTAWLEFLESLWASNQESISTLQEMFGYLLLPDTSQQKMFLLVGPPRSGKGTIARVLVELVGKHNTSAPTLNSLGDSFGLEPLLGKQLAVISDLRLGRKTDQAMLAENLLRISGEDMVTANRKYKSAWTGQLAIRFLIMTNQMPRFADNSGALANRFIPLIMTESFLGRERPGLINEILPELPGILNWAVDGWRRLYERGHFAMPATSKTAVQQLVDLASPVSAFMRDRCELHASAVVPKSELFSAWAGWCNANGDLPTGAASTFGSNLIAASHGRISANKARSGGQRVPVYKGVSLLTLEGGSVGQEHCPF